MTFSSKFQHETSILLCIQFVIENFRQLNDDDKEPEEIAISEATESNAAPENSLSQM